MTGTLRPSGTLRAGGTGGTRCTLLTRCADGTRLTSGTLWSLWSREALLTASASGTTWTGRSGSTCYTDHVHLCHNSATTS